MDEATAIRLRPTGRVRLKAARVEVEAEVRGVHRAFQVGVRTI